MKFYFPFSFSIFYYLLLLINKQHTQATFHQITKKMKYTLVSLLLYICCVNGSSTTDCGLQNSITILSSSNPQYPKTYPFYTPLFTPYTLICTLIHFLYNCLFDFLKTSCSKYLTKFHIFSWCLCMYKIHF